MNLEPVFTANWPYKIAAIVLAVLLWFSVSADRERNDQQVPTVLELTVADSGWSVRDAPAQVMTTFQGRGGDIFALFNRPRIRKVIASVEDTVMEITFSPSEVLYDRSLNVRPTAVIPGRISVRFERRQRKRIAVRVLTDARAAPGFMIAFPRVEPESVSVRGPESLVNSITDLSTEVLQLGEVRERVTRQVAVSLPVELSGVEVSPATVLVSLAVDTVRTSRFQRRVTAVGPYAADVVIDPPSVVVEVTGSASEIAALDPTDLEVTVDVNEPVDEIRRVRLKVALPEGVMAHTTILPPRVSLRPRVDPPPPPVRPH